KAVVHTPDDTGLAFPAVSLPASLQAVDEHMARGAFADALAVLDRLLALDATNEAAVYRLITLLTGQKRRGEALRAYQRFAESLQRLRNISPSQELQALYEAVRRGETVPYAVSEPLSTHNAVAEIDHAFSDRAATDTIADASPVPIG